MISYPFLETAAALFGAAALGGLLMAGMRYAGVPRPPAWLALGHGLLAAAGLTLLIFAACTIGIPPLAQYALALFLLAATAGAVMNLMFHQQQKPLPMLLMFGHALLAVSGYALLLRVIFG